MVAPIGALGLDAVGREDLAGLERDDGDLALVGDGEDATTTMGRPDPQVMQAPGLAQGHGAGLVARISSDDSAAMTHAEDEVL